MLIPDPSTRNGWLFPPRTREVQLDEKWGFVYRKGQPCDPEDPLDRFRGDDWDHPAIDPESRALLASVPGRRDTARCREPVPQVHDRTAGRPDLLITGDAHAPYARAIEAVYGVAPPQPERPGPGRPPEPERVLPPELCYATVNKKRTKGRVVEVVRALIVGTMLLPEAYPERSRVSTTINRSFIARHHGTDRHQGARKHRKTYGSSEAIGRHHAASSFIGYRSNFCGCVRTLRIRGEDGVWQPRTPAMAAGLTDHVRSLRERITFPAKPH